ncbi:MAG: hypothetical protein AAB525_00975 [Patescibacteria group bacterium]
MHTAQIGFKTTPQIKIQAQRLSNNLGVNLSSVLNGLLKQFIRTKRLELSIDPQPSEFALDMIAESKEDRKNGRYSPAFDNAENAIDYLHKEAKKYAN